MAIVSRSYTLTIETDEDTLRAEYPNFRLNYSNEAEFAAMLVRGIVENSDRSAEYGYRVMVSPPIKC